MSVDVSVYLPRPPLSVAALKQLMRRHGWVILAYEALREQDSVPAEETGDGVDIIGWESGGSDAQSVARALEDGTLDRFYEELGVCEVSIAQGEELQDILDELVADADPRLARSLQKSLTCYTISAAVGSAAECTPELQDALFEALSGLKGAVTEVDGELDV